MSALAPCSQCSRHVQLDAAFCPFCGATTAGLSPSPKAAPPLGAKGLTRAAILFGAALTVGGAGVGCGDDDASRGGSDESGGEHVAVPVYGAPAPDAPTQPDGDDPSTPEDATDAGAPVAAYGAPAPS